MDIVDGVDVMSILSTLSMLSPGSVADSLGQLAFAPQV